jgi:hypothetical protein
VPADVGDADAVAIEGDAADDPAHHPSRRLHIGRAEEQAVEHRERARAHREDVAEDPAHAGGGALVGLDRRRMVVALDLEHAEQSVAEVDRAGVLARAERDARAGGRQRAEQRLAVLVRAVLAPHRAEHAPLERVRIAAEDRKDPLGFALGESGLAREPELRLRRRRPRDHRGDAHETVPSPRKTSI